jgi:outer membrane protein assembly factor BamD
MQGIIISRKSAVPMSTRTSNHHPIRFIHCVLLGTSLVLAACANKDKQPENQTEQGLYQAAAEQLDKDNYGQAVGHLQQLEARYPFGPYAEQAQLELIYAHYKSFNYSAVIEACERFIRLHPQHPNVDYAYYMRGLANFSQGRGMFDRFALTDVTQRDPGAARQSFNDFSQLVSRFPNSQYAPDARARMLYQRNLLARYEINVANYYLMRRAFVAAANRGRYVVENFPQAPAVPDALAIMVQSYLILEQDDLAADSLKVLVKNFPDHPNLDKKGNFNPVYSEKGVKPSLRARATFGLFGRADPPQINNKKFYENGF